MHDLAAIRAFDALNQHKSLTSAAKALNQPKSTISRRLAQLEEDVGQALTARQGNRLILTKAGKIFARYSRQMLELADESQDALQGLNNKISGQLHIVCHAALVRSWLSGVLNQFLSENPDVKIRLSSDVNSTHNEPDLVLWVGPCPSLEWREETLGYWRYAPYASPEYLRQHGQLTSPQELHRHPWIDFGCLRERELTLHHSEHGEFKLEPLSSRLHSDNVALQIDAIANGHGIGLLPTWTVQGYQRHHPGRIVPCLDSWLSEPVAITCYTPAGRHPLRLSVLLDALQQQVPLCWSKG